MSHSIGIDIAITAFGVGIIYLVVWHMMTVYPDREGPIKDLKRWLWPGDRK